MNYPALIVAAAEKLSERLYELPALKTPETIEKAKRMTLEMIHPAIAEVLVAIITREKDPSMAVLETYGRLYYLMHDKMPNEREIRALYNKKHTQYMPAEGKRFNEVLYEIPEILRDKLMDPLEDPQQSAHTMALWYALLRACGHLKLFNRESPSRDAAAEILENTLYDFKWIRAERNTEKYDKERKRTLARVRVKDTPDGGRGFLDQIPAFIKDRKIPTVSLYPVWATGPNAFPIPFSWSLMRDWTVRLKQEMPIQPDEFLKLWDNDGIFPPPEIKRMIGLDHPKQQFMRLYAGLLRDKAMKAADIEVIDTEAPGNNLLFAGPPGVAKTTFARMAGRLFHRLGVLTKGHVVEAKRKDLVGRYIGHTAPKTAAVVKKAAGGVLFVDEAYQLMGSSNDFGSEALEVIMGAMEDQRGELVTIMAGYPDDMNRLLDMNDGLESRFRHIISFPAYTETELHQIFEQKAKNAGLIINDDARAVAYQTITRAKETSDPKTFGNGRYIRDFTHAVQEALSFRLLEEKKLPGDMPLGSEAMEVFLNTRFQGGDREVLVTPTPDDIRNARIFDRKAIESRGRLGFGPG